VYKTRQVDYLTFADLAVLASGKNEENEFLTTVTNMSRRSAV
jgi:hypothetical protein